MRKFCKASSSRHELKSPASTIFLYFVESVSNDLLGNIGTVAKPFLFIKIDYNKKSSPQRRNHDLTIWLGYLPKCKA